MESWMRPNIKCVCIKKGKWFSVVPGVINDLERNPKFGDIVTIEEVVMNEVVLSLRFKEYLNLYDASQFRPLVNEEDDIKMFKELLQDIYEPV